MGPPHGRGSSLSMLMALIVVFHIIPWAETHLIIVMQEMYPYKPWNLSKGGFVNVSHANNPLVIDSSPF